MNDSLLTYSGGQPLYADDLSFMQNSLSAMTNHLSKAFGDTYIVWGCLDEGKTNVVEGAVCIGGKLYEVPALGVLGENKLCYREVQSDERVFEDGQKHKVKKSYEAYLSADTSGAVAYIDLKTAVVPFKTINDDIKDKVLPDDSQWESIELSEGVEGYASKKNNFLGQAYAIKINIRFSKYNPSERLFSSMLPSGFESEGVSINNTQSQKAISASLTRFGELSDYKGDGLTLSGLDSGFYAIKAFIIKPVG